ncbi:hypothetical protein [Actinomadura kijaniata]|uniref:hypothetical protein n=1 Tax=Actinomadura kijaniata TaxID=46161 RepID=UPI00082BEE4A|nr:hypothetical protein [Actinomadura kijaniata]
MGDAGFGRERLWAVLFRVGLGGALLVIAWGIHAEDAAFARRAVTVDATVTGVAEAAVRDEGASGEGDGVAMVRFRAGGRDVSARVLLDDVGEVRQGQILAVGYDPRNPVRVVAPPPSGGPEPQAIVYVTALAGLLLLIPWRLLARGGNAVRGRR